MSSRKRKSTRNSRQRMAELESAVENLLDNDENNELDVVVLPPDNSRLTDEEDIDEESTSGK